MSEANVPPAKMAQFALYLVYTFSQHLSQKIIIPSNNIIATIGSILHTYMIWCILQNVYKSLAF